MGLPSRAPVADSGSFGPATLAAAGLAAPAAGGAGAFFIKVVRLSKLALASPRLMIVFSPSRSSRRPTSRYAPRNPRKRAISSVPTELKAAVTPKTKAMAMDRSMIPELGMLVLLGPDWFGICDG